MSAAPNLDPRWEVIAAYIQRGWPVMRLRGKLAAGKPWDDYTARSLDDIPRVFPIGGTWNMGLRLDLVPGLVVMDLDAVKYPESVAEFRRLSGIDPADDMDGHTRVMTGAALPDGSQPGRHFYVQSTPEEVDAHGWKSMDAMYDIPGLDVKVSHLTKGRRGQCYVVLPESIHPSGKRYRWASQGTEPVPMTDGIRAYLDGAFQKPEREAKPEPKAEQAPPPPPAKVVDDFARYRLEKAIEKADRAIRNAPPGKRQGTTNQAAYELGYLTQKLPATMQAEALRAAEAADAARISVEDAAADQARKDRGEYGDVERAFRDGQATANDAHYGPPIEQKADPLTAALQKSPQTATGASVDAEGEPEGVDPFPFYSLSGLHQIAPPSPLVSGVINQGDYVGFAGKSSTGKSVFVLDMGLRIASGKPWRGFPVTQGAVVYVAAEGSHGIKIRLAAWGHAHSENVDALPFRTVRHPAKIADVVERARLIATIQKVAEDTGFPVVLVVLDTMAQTFTGNENAPEDMGAYIAACHEIREATGAAVGVVHHFGHTNERGRGHSSWDGAMDVGLGFRAVGTRRFASCDKENGGKPPKDLPPFPNLPYHLRRVIADTAYGPVDSVVAMEGDDPNATPEQSERTDKAWNIVRAAIAEDGPQYQSGLVAIIKGNKSAAIALVKSWVLDGRLVEAYGGRLGLPAESAEQGTLDAD